jgi:hypothetical protein
LKTKEKSFLMSRDKMQNLKMTLGN